MGAGRVLKRKCSRKIPNTIRIPLAAAVEVMKVGRVTIPARSRSKSTWVERSAKRADRATKNTTVAISGREIGGEERGTLKGLVRERAHRNGRRKSIRAGSRDTERNIVSKRDLDMATSVVLKESLTPNPSTKKSIEVLGESKDGAPKTSKFLLFKRDKIIL